MLYVDGLRPHVRRGRECGSRETCHLATDREIGELHAFAASIGVHRMAYHAHARHPHYDLDARARALAVAAGALEVTTKELVRCCFARVSGIRFDD